MTPQLLSVCLAVALFLAVCVARACWIVAVEAEQDRADAEEQREADAKDLRRVKLALTHYIERTHRAETVVADLLMEQAEDDALARELAAWKRDMDPSLAAMTPEQVERLWSAIWTPDPSVQPSPSKHYASLADLVREAGGRIQ